MLKPCVQDKKLKKDESVVLIKKLAKSQIDTSLLKSSKTLGVSRESKRELLSRALNEQNAGLKTKQNHSILFKNPQLREDSLYDSSSSESDAGTPNTTSAASAASFLSGVGQGLKRPLEVGSNGNPIITKRRRLRGSHMRKSFEEPSWEGFDSSESGAEVSSVGTQTVSDPNEGTAFSDEPTDDEAYSQATSEDSQESNLKAARKERSSAFKAWATQQVNNALGFTPNSPVISAQTTSINHPHHVIKPREIEREPLPPELETRSKVPDRKAFSMQVQRSPEIQEARFGLPIVAEEQKIMEAIYNNPAVVIWGATGSGKTTQVPQFLYEAGYGSPGSPTPGMIGVTQPRRVAAVSMAKRVSDELGSASGKVSYQIRFDSTVGAGTAIKFMTDGILLREIAKDFLLSKYSAIIIDEAHERSTNTDILIGMISRIIDLRASMGRDNPHIKPLKLVIMSATLRISDFTENANLFRNGPPPLLQAEGRQYPVSIHFARKTQPDYLDEMFNKVSKGHRKLPPGGMLVFLTGQNEIAALAKRLRQAFVSAQSSSTTTHRVQIATGEAPVEAEDVDLGYSNASNLQIDDGSETENDAFEDDDDRAFNIGDGTPGASQIHVLPLYSQLPTKEQLRVFETPPENARLIVLATNVAETSLTIPGIRYVFDCGRAKEKKYDCLTGVQNFEIGWISKASALQRAGRAGRTGPGHSYRLYSSAVYERDFDEHAEPEILRMPVEGVVLQLKSMDLQQVINFPFPTPPDREGLIKAEKLLGYLGAISSDGQITPIGRGLSIYPLSPRFSKMLLIGHQHGCMLYTIALVAALAMPDLFVQENQLDLTLTSRGADEVYTNSDRLEDTAKQQRKSAYNHAHHLFSKKSKTSDALKCLTALCAYSYAPNSDAFCQEMFLRPKALTEASHLREQLSNIVRANQPQLLPTYEPRLPEPSSKQLKALQQIVAAGYIDQIAIRADLSPSPPELPRKPSRAIDVPYLPLFPTRQRKAEDLLEKAVFVHPSSVLAHILPKELPQYVFYSNLQRSSPTVVNDTKRPRIRMHPLVSLSGKQIAALANGTTLLEYGKPIGKIRELEGKARERECFVVPSLIGEKGGLGWPLPAVKVVQKKNDKGIWGVDKVVG